MLLDGHLCVKMLCSTGGYSLSLVVNSLSLALTDRRKSAATIIGVKQISQLYFLTKDLNASLREEKNTSMGIDGKRQPGIKRRGARRVFSLLGFQTTTERTRHLL